MALSRKQQEEYIRTHKFDELFVHQGWDLAANAAPLAVKLNDHTFNIQVTCQKRGFVIALCQDEKIFQLSNTELKHLLLKFSSFHYEHLLIAYNNEQQRWAVSIRPQDRPVKTADAKWHKSQDLQVLIEKLQGLIFPLAEEEKLTIVEVVQRVRTAFSTNMEAVTNQFYSEFQKQLTTFEKFIKGIQRQVDQKQYAALMLNRLMFIYFIQKKGFLDGKLDYLQHHLAETQKSYGKDKFHDEFYRVFLHRLFHEGLDTPTHKRTTKIKRKLGNIPYLNGGLFNIHQIEEANDTSIQIPDAAFKNLFDFFDKYQWHLDTSSNASGNEINPDILGYIFEKYINNRAQMGAYYTQEDITGYIAKNTIIPFLLQHTKENCKNAFTANGIWRFLKADPDKYIYDAIKHGCDKPDKDIPKHIRDGINATKPNLLERRKDWNTPAPEEFALPTETWRETIARRQRYHALKTKMENGGITSINDLITENLDIERFASIALLEYEGSDFIAAFFKAIAGVRYEWVKGTSAKDNTKRGISILDPACGSGAFLFAALNILEPLYEKCIMRMREFVEHDNNIIAAKKAKGEKASEKHLFFREVIAEIETHPNESYWIYKTIILHNLYGVDIMQEATEIAKLRLFLKLAAEAKYEPSQENLGLDPLPDIDYNIHAGNALVGFVNMKQLEATSKNKLGLETKILDKVRQKAQQTQMAYDKFCRSQGDSRDDYAQAKEELKQELERLNETLNDYLAQSYGKIKENDIEKYQAWEKSHQPFHWLAGFYGIIEDNGGFDVIIGNPPYVEYSKVRDEYRVQGYKTESCGNIYAYFMERILSIKNKDTRCSMIVPLSGHSTPRMESLVANFYRAPHQQTTIFNISADAHPSQLFPDVKFRLAIFNTMPGSETYTTGYTKFYANERSNLFPLLQYTKLTDSLVSLPTIAKIKSPMHAQILEKMLLNEKRELGGSRGCNNTMYYHNAPVNWIRAHTKPPYFSSERDGTQISGQLKALHHLSLKNKKLGFLTLTSSTFFIWWLAISDCYHLNIPHLASFPFSFSDGLTGDIGNTAKKLEADMKTKSRRRVYNYTTTGRVEYDEFYMKESKALIDQADILLAHLYDFSDEELDYIINYDIKYRMGDID